MNLNNTEKRPLSLVCTIALLSIFSVFSAGCGGGGDETTVTEAGAEEEFDSFGEEMPGPELLETDTSTTANTVQEDEEIVSDPFADMLLKGDSSNQLTADSVGGSTLEVSLFSETPPANAATKGFFSPLVDWPFHPVHSALLPDGRVMTYGTKIGRPALGFTYDIWDPSIGTGPNSHVTLDVETTTNLFCSAQSLLTNGNLLITGGDQFSDGGGGVKNDGIDRVNLYDFAAEQMFEGSKMSHARWYPTLVPLPDGRTLVHGGRSSTNGDKSNKDSHTIASYPEIYSSETDSWSPLLGADRPDVYTPGSGGWYYPRSWLSKTGSVIFFTKNSNAIYELNPEGRGEIKALNTSKHGIFKHYYPAVEYRPGRILTLRSGNMVTSLNTRNSAKGVIREKVLSAIPKNRIWSDATVLPNGEVLVSGGSEIAQDLSGSVREAYLYNPEEDSWSIGASAKADRLYHSSTVLLQNGAVLTAGGGPPGPVANHNAEIYYPPYLFDSNGDWAERPKITEVPERISNATEFEFGTDSFITKAVLMRVGSTTHTLDMTQSYRELTIESTSSLLGYNYSAKKVGRANITPPGWYFLFVLNEAGVPSEAKIIKVSAFD